MILDFHLGLSISFVYLANSVTCLSQYGITSHRSINSVCNSAFECGENAICGGSVIRKCRCKMGHLPADNRIDCEHLKCAHHSECHKHFGNKTLCFHSSFGHYCSCASTKYLKLDENTQTCVAVKCLDNSHCSDTMFCYHAKCRCRMGFVAEANGYQCTADQCKRDVDCAKFDSNAKCFTQGGDHHGVCDCDTRFHLDSKSHSCVLTRDTALATRNLFLTVASFIFIIPAIVCLVRGYRQRVNTCTGGSQQSNSVQSNSSQTNHNQSRPSFSAETSMEIYRISRLIHTQRQLHNHHNNINTVNERVSESKFADMPPSYDKVYNEDETKNSTHVKRIHYGEEPPPPSYDTLQSCNKI